MKNKNNFKLTEPIILAFEREKQDSSLLKKYRRGQKFKTTYSVLFLRLIFIVLLIGSSIYIYMWHTNNLNNARIIEMISSYVTIDTSSDQGQSLDISFDNLRAINNSCFGWIDVNNTNISYPIVHYTNNDYYLSHSFDNSNNPAGWIFADYRNACNGYDKNLIIYGHNRKNNTMFSELNNCLNSDWYTNSDNKIITLYTPLETLKYEIFSLYSIQAENYYTTTSFLSDSIFQTFLDEIKGRSIYDFNTSVSGDDNILTLSTCSNNSANRTVIHAKKLLEKDSVPSLESSSESQLNQSEKLSDE